jgi:hypothetical protein
MPVIRLSGFGTGAEDTDSRRQARQTYPFQQSPARKRGSNETDSALFRRKAHGLVRLLWEYDCHSRPCPVKDSSGPSPTPTISPVVPCCQKFVDCLFAWRQLKGPSHELLIVDLIVPPVCFTSSRKVCLASSNLLKSLSTGIPSLALGGPRRSGHLSVAGDALRAKLEVTTRSTIVLSTPFERRQILPAVRAAQS